MPGPGIGSLFFPNAATPTPAPEPLPIPSLGLLDPHPQSHRKSELVDGGEKASIGGGTDSCVDDGWMDG